MKKITLLLAAVVMITGGAFAQEKACCKKGAHCSKACKKDGAKETTKTTGTNTTKSEPAKPKA